MAIVKEGTFGYTNGIMNAPDLRPDPFPYIVGFVGLLFGIAISVAARAEPNEQDLAELTQLVSEAQDPAHVDLLLVQLRDAREAAAISEQAHTQLLEQAMAAAPGRVVRELARSVDMNALASLPSMDQKAWLNEASRQLRLGERRANRAWNRARRWDDDSATLCAFQRVTELERLRELDAEARADWSAARAAGDSEALEEALARVSVLRDLGWRRIESLQACSIRRPQAEPTDIQACEEDLEPATFDWYHGILIPPTETCTPLIDVNLKRDPAR